MPRDGTQTYVLPFPDVVEDTTIESTVYNGFTNDVAQDLNTPRPIKFGGTGAVDAATARFNLATEIAAQVVTNYDSHLWVPGSFYSATTATGEPVDGRAFSGVAYIGEALANPPTNQNVTLEARDTTDGKLYIRRKTAGVWGAWIVDTAVADAKVAKAGDTMTGELRLPDGTTTVPSLSFANETTAGMWRVGASQIGWTTGGITRLTLSGTALTSTLPVALPADPTTALQAATKQYVDTRDNAISGHGQCLLLADTGTLLHLYPINGNALKINGVTQSIPTGGITLSGVSTTNATLYYIYAWMNGATMTLEHSTTGHATSTTAGNIGVEIKSGDNTRTLVGMAYSQGTTGQWTDTPALRFVRSWFNDFGVVGSNGAGDTQTTLSTSTVLAPNTQGALLAWGREQYSAVVGGQCFNNVAGVLVYINIMVDGSNVGFLGMQQNITPSYQSWASTNYAAVFSNEGLHTIALGFAISGGGAVASIASRVMSYMTMRR